MHVFQPGFQSCILFLKRWLLLRSQTTSLTPSLERGSKGARVQLVGNSVLEVYVVVCHTERAI